MKIEAHSYKDILFTIETTRIGYIFKAEHNLTILKQTYIGYSLPEAKKRFKLEIKREFIFDDYQNEQYKMKTNEQQNTISLQ